jgi:hypothetical protein
MDPDLVPDPTFSSLTFKTPTKDKKSKRSQKVGIKVLGIKVFLTIFA